MASRWRASTGRKLAGWWTYRIRSASVRWMPTRHSEMPRRATVRRGTRRSAEISGTDELTLRRCLLGCGEGRSNDSSLRVRCTARLGQAHGRQVLQPTHRLGITSVRQLFPETASVSVVAKPARRGGFQVQALQALCGSECHARRAQQGAGVRRGLRAQRGHRLVDITNSARSLTSAGFRLACAGMATRPHFPVDPI